MKNTIGLREAQEESVSGNTEKEEEIVLRAAKDYCGWMLDATNLSIGSASFDKLCSVIAPAITEAVAQLKKDKEAQATEIRELRAVTTAYDKVINSLPKDELVRFANAIPAEFRAAIGGEKQ